MQKNRTNDRWPGTSVAHEHSKGIERVLDQLGRVIADKHGQRPAFQPREVEQTARNTYDAEYVVRSYNERQLSLRFIVTGENGDLVLLQTQEKPHPGVIDQHV